jgi:ketosteroid isomerase-like protein
MTDTLEQEILAQEERLTLATRRLDLDALARLYADDILFTGATGVICDKASLMGEARRGVAERQAAADAAGTQHFVTAYDKDDIRVVTHGDTAVTGYRFTITIRNGDQEHRRSYRTTNVWLKRKDGWQVIAGHTAGVDSVPA